MQKNIASTILAFLCGILLAVLISSLNSSVSTVKSKVSNPETNSQVVLPTVENPVNIASKPVLQQPVVLPDLLLHKEISTLNCRVAQLELDLRRQVSLNKALAKSQKKEIEDISRLNRINTNLLKKSISDKEAYIKILNAKIAEWVIYSDKLANKLRLAKVPEATWGAAIHNYWHN